MSLKVMHSKTRSSHAYTHTHARKQAAHTHTRTHTHHVQCNSVVTLQHRVMWITLCLTNIPCRGEYRNRSNHTHRVSLQSLFMFCFGFSCLVVVVVSRGVARYYDYGGVAMETTMCCTQFLTTYNKTSAPLPQGFMCAPWVWGNLQALIIKYVFPGSPLKGQKSILHWLLRRTIFGGRKVGENSFGLSFLVSHCNQTKSCLGYNNP